MANVTQTEKDAVLFLKKIKIKSTANSGGEREKDQAVLEELSL